MRLPRLVKARETGTLNLAFERGGLLASNHSVWVDIGTPCPPGYRYCGFMRGRDPARPLWPQGLCCNESTAQCTRKGGAPFCEPNISSISKALGGGKPAPPGGGSQPQYGSVPVKPQPHYAEATSPLL